jgi:hypothetical protein
MFETLLRRRNSGPASPRGGWYFSTEFIQICRIFVVDFDKKHHIHQILQFSKPNLLVRGSAKSIGFTVNLLRMCVTMCFALPASQGCPSDPRSCAGHTMWSIAGALSSSACSPGDMPRQVPRGRVRDFSVFESQTTEGDPDETGWTPLPGLHSCDYGS